jgi:hypothetical protein
MPLVVEPISFEAASSIFGRLGYSIWNEACGDIDRPGMAGDDPTGRDWAAAYDQAATRCVDATDAVINGCFRLAALLEQTGFNYSVAELASDPRTPHQTPDVTSWSGITCYLARPLSAAGSGSPGPAGWSLVSDLVGSAWPNGHQDGLLAVAQAWSRSAAVLRHAAEATWQAEASLADSITPERPAAETACRSMRAHLVALADAHERLGRACADYARQLGAAHAAVLDELEELVAWTVGIEVAGGLASVFSFGLAEAPAQAAEAARIGWTATRVAALIERFAIAVRSARFAVVAVGDQVGTTVTALRPLLSAEPAVVGVNVVRATDLRGMTAAARIEVRAQSALSGAALRRAELDAISKEFGWAKPATLERHFADHGADFGVTSPRAYARAARRFYRRAQRERLPAKVDESGDVRIYDPAANTFACFTREGATRTFFKPSSPTYWARQPGVLR